MQAALPCLPRGTGKLGSRRGTRSSLFTDRKTEREALLAHRVREPVLERGWLSCVPGETNRRTANTSVLARGRGITGTDPSEGQAPPTARSHQVRVATAGLTLPSP